MKERIYLSTKDFDPKVTSYQYGYHCSHQTAPCPIPYVPESNLNELEEWAYKVEEYLAARSDVKDGDYGQPEPNEEMKLLTEFREMYPPEET